MSSNSKSNTSGCPRCGTSSPRRHLNGLNPPCAVTGLLWMAATSCRSPTDSPWAGASRAGARAACVRVHERIHSSVHAPSPSVRVHWSQWHSEGAATDLVGGSVHGERLPPRRHAEAGHLRVVAPGQPRMLRVQIAAPAQGPVRAASRILCVRVAASAARFCTTVAWCHRSSHRQD